ncbi:hypothetical protein FHR83_008008 [Actinoplanes campanulatus]|uniref:Uncharacterized protein n=1 Tax=Actinoplanes campanulatus TaxID=113559 RepID=A0A7W5FJ29_9ACTN|nr:hypothetical protein [Actinoplanes campanulatus]MBB3100286.1 hypothetical protein [Actinoplanes campanulatus]GGN44054.1 hypothetical protein GCM10010109_76840 [Actinoplanes campanulatus]GID40912.1 hypothetical protein Aca09nite_74180 [Actinoplanes campanulatus]
MPALSEHMNVYTTAIAVLENKGFSIWYDRERDTFCAERDGWDFWADNPISLLGLAAIFEYKKPSEYTNRWWETEGGIRYPNVPETAPEYTPAYGHSLR